MVNAKLLLTQWLSEEDFANIGQAVANGYSGCNALMSNNIIFSAFAIGRDLRSRLLNVCVEYELDRISMNRPEFKPQIQYNNAHNCLHLRLHKDGLILTSHFMGKDFRTLRKKVRIAKNREMLADRNGDLFEEETKKIDISINGIAYCQVIHGGNTRPILSMLAIPTYDQLGISASCELPTPEPEIVSEEKIEEYIIKLHTQTEEFENGNIEKRSGRFSA